MRKNHHTPLRIFSFVIVLVVSLLAAAAPASPSAMYTVQLQAGQEAEPDFAALGGTVVSKAGNRCVVRLPDDAVELLQKHPRVQFLQRVFLGEPLPAMPEGHAAARGPREMQVDAMPPTWSSGRYLYDAAGNIKAIGTSTEPNADGKANTYVYDPVSRLVSATGNYETNTTETYQYDSFGNLVSIGRGGQSVSLPASKATNRLSGAEFEYDAAGNLTKRDAVETYIYDSFNMMRAKVSAAGAELYVYTADDERIGIETGMGQRWTFRGLDGKVLREWSGSNTWWWEQDYVYRNGQLVAGEREPADGGTRHYHLDHLGTPRLITDAAGRKISSHDYMPFGYELTNFRQEMLDRGTSSPDPMKFTSHERDFTGGTATDNSNYLDYMHARFYNPLWGRFFAVDPGASANAKKPQTWNRYSYGLNSPINNVDPDGRYVAVATQLRRDISQAYANSPTFRAQYDAVHRNRSILQKLTLGQTRLAGVRAQTNEDHNGRGVMYANGQVLRAPDGSLITSIKLTTLLPPGNIGAKAGHELRHGIEFRLYGSPALAEDAHSSAGGNGIETDTAQAIELQIKNELQQSGLRASLTPEEEANLFDVPADCTTDGRKCPKLEPVVDSRTSIDARPPS